MGCAGSKKDVINVEQHNPTSQIPQPKPSIPQNHEDEEAQILSKGKNINKTALDEITETKKLQSKPQEKPSTIPTGKQQASSEAKPLTSETHSKSLLIDHKPSESQLKGPPESSGLSESIILNDINESNETLAVKSKTFKPGFQSHPHEFDFSFIEEQKIKEQKEKDLLAEELLKEMSEIN